MTNVVITYFKESGKYYTSGGYNSSKTWLFEIVEEVVGKQRERKLPGLEEGFGREFTILIVATNCPPHLIHPAEVLP